MLSSFRKSGSNPIVWGILGILVVGLIGFGGRVSSGIGASGVAAVGSETVSTDDYLRAMQNELQRLSQQFGQQISIEQATAFGVDQIVLSQLVTAAALNGKTREFGISVGDAAVRDNLLRTPAFQGVDGKFDRDAYDYALERLNMTAAEYDRNVRNGVARDLLRTGIASGVAMPVSAAATLLAYSGEQRSFDWVTLDVASLPAPVAAPTEPEVQAWYDAHNDQFMSPETRDISYLALMPADLAGKVAVTDEQVKAAYDARIDEFEQPETRAVERLAFATEADAQAALARLNSGEISFEALVAERDLQLADLDLGIIARKSLDPEAQQAVFGPAGPGVYGPAVTLLGPALFRVNAIFAAQSTPFEQAAVQLKQEIALQEAAGLVGDEAVRLDDLLAGGATLEEIDAETAFTLASIAWHPGLSDGIAADPAFVTEAEALTEGEDRDPVDLAGGGIALLRLDSITAPALRPFAEVRAEAMAASRAAAESARIAEYAEALVAEIGAARSLAALATEKSLALRPSAPVRRGGSVAEAPAGLVEKLFALKDMETAIIPGDGRADILQLTAVIAFDASAEENQAVVAEANRQLSEQAGDDLFAVFANSAQQEAGVSINAALVQALLDRFQ